MGRTFAIGDVHGDRVALDRLLGKLPFIAPDDTLVFLGDYIDRGPDSRGVVERMRRLPEEIVGKVVLLRGNHEDAYLNSIGGEIDVPFFMIRGNGVAEAFRSWTDRDPTSKEELSNDEATEMFDIHKWLPAPVQTWLKKLELWYEDDHAIYVHAGLEGEGAEWKHPRDGAEKPLLWMREQDFYEQYAGKQLVFGHTPVSELPPRDPDRAEVWHRGPLWGIDTGCGKGGHLSCVELPSGTVYDSR